MWWRVAGNSEGLIDTGEIRWGNMNSIRMSASIYLGPYKPIWFSIFLAYVENAVDDVGWEVHRLAATRGAIAYMLLFHVLTMSQLASGRPFDICVRSSIPKVAHVNLARAT
jgi:hypothetical protein